jgi:protein-S-isoprenylcysteine O-methyltransferase Ste14
MHEASSRAILDQWAAWLALSLGVVYVAVTFGVRTWLHRRRTSSSGIAGVERTWRARTAAFCFVIAAACAFVGPVLGGIGVLRPVGWLGDEFVRVVGLVLFPIGAVRTDAAQYAMGDAWRIGVDPSQRTRLVTTGLFRRTRNPIFVSTILALSGIVLLVPNVVTLAALVFLVVAVELQVRWVEEPFLLRIHGDAYRAYAERTGRFLPGIGRLRDAATRPPDATSQRPLMSLAAPSPDHGDDHSEEPPR